MKYIITLLFCVFAAGGVQYASAQGVQNNGIMYISGNVGILGTYNFTNETGASYLNNGNLYIYADFTNKQTTPMVASVAGNAAGTIWFQGAATQALNGTQDFNFYQMQLNKTAAGNLVNMSRNVTTVNNLTLTKGIVTTGTNLFTWNNTGTLTSPNNPWVAHTASYADSYIATCDASGTPLTVANATTPLTSSYGFMIKNIGTGGTITEVYFPVGATYLTSGTGVATPAPNRMSIKNTGVADNFNVVVTYGDIGGTPQPKVNRIWYVNSGLSTNKVTMKLFFTERTTSNWPLIENEVENLPSPFDYTNMILVEKDYVAANNNFIAIASGTDVQNFPNGTYNNEEVYGLYTVGVSADVAGNKNGITQFNRFTITNPGGIILPVTIVNLKAYQQNSDVKVDWTSVDETNIDHYEVERAADGANFFYLGSVAALNNGQQSINYHFTDGAPFGGDNYYRIRAVDKDAKAIYSNVARVNISDVKPGIIVYPNPVTGHYINIRFNNMAAGTYNLILYDNLGRKTAQKDVQHPGGSASYNLYVPAGTARGYYHLNIQDGKVIVDKSLLVD